MEKESGVFIHIFSLWIKVAKNLFTNLELFTGTLAVLLFEEKFFMKKFFMKNVHKNAFPLRSISFSSSRITFPLKKMNNGVGPSDLRSSRVSHIQVEKS